MFDISPLAQTVFVAATHSQHLNEDSWLEKKKKKLLSYELQCDGRFHFGTSVCAPVNLNAERSFGQTAVGRRVERAATQNWIQFAESCGRDAGWAELKDTSVESQDRAVNTTLPRVHLCAAKRWRDC